MNLRRHPLAREGGIHGSRKPKPTGGLATPESRRRCASGFRISPHRPGLGRPGATDRISSARGLRRRFISVVGQCSGLKVRLTALSQGWAPCCNGSGGGVGHWPGAHPPHPSASPLAASRIGPGALRCRASLPRRCSRPVGVGFSAVPQVASPASSSRRQQQSTLLLENRFQFRDMGAKSHSGGSSQFATAFERLAEGQARRPSPSR